MRCLVLEFEEKNKTTTTVELKWTFSHFKALVLNTWKPRQPISSMGLYGLYAPACFYLYFVLPVFFLFLMKTWRYQQHRCARTHVLKAQRRRLWGRTWRWRSHMWVHICIAMSRFHCRRFTWGTCVRKCVIASAFDRTFRNRTCVCAYTPRSTPYGD